MLASAPAKLEYTDDVARARGKPNMMGRYERFVVDVRVCPTRKRAFRTPSRLRKRMVLRISSKWIAAVPNARGEAMRNMAWFSTNVKRREKSCSAMSEDAEEKDDLKSNSLLGLLLLAIADDGSVDGLVAAMSAVMEVVCLSLKLYALIWV